MNSPLLIGHRGAMGLVAENTLESISKALALGVDGIEIDVHRCKTGELVVIHDDTIDRTTNGTGMVSELTLTELKSFRIDDTLQIPTLSEVLNLISNQCVLNIELKGKKTAQATVDLITTCLNESSWKKSNFLISSFHEKQLKKVAKLDPELPVAVLTRGKFKKALRLAKKIKAFSIHPEYSTLKSYHIWRAHRRKFKVIVWSINEPKDFQRMLRYKVDGIITNYPDRYATL